MAAGKALQRDNGWRKENSEIFRTEVGNCFQCWRDLQEWLCTAQTPRRGGGGGTSSASTTHPPPAIMYVPPWIDEDEEDLFGRTIISMLRKLPLSERNRVKVQIFSVVVSAQDNYSRREYLV